MTYYLSTLSESDGVSGAEFETVPPTTPMYLYEIQPIGSIECAITFDSEATRVSAILDHLLSVHNLRPVTAQV